MDIKQKIEDEAERKYTNLPGEDRYPAIDCFTAGATFTASLYEERIKELEEELRNEHNLLINALTDK